MLVERDRLMILVIVGRRTDEHCFRREVGIGLYRNIKSFLSQIFVFIVYSSDVTSSVCDGLNKVTDGVASTAHVQSHSTVEKECQTTKSSVRRWKTKQEQMRRVRLGMTHWLY